MAAGTTFKACGCRNEDGKLWGRKCPQLKRKGGGWSRHHGTWYYQLELPQCLDGTRRNPIRRAGSPPRIWLRSRLPAGTSCSASASRRQTTIASWS